MYESPIVQKMQEITNWMMEERENGVMLKVTETIGYDIDKGELIRALNYDRDQYTKGYKEAEKEMLKMLDKIRAQIEPKCDRINSLASVLSYAAHREIQELLCEIMDLFDPESEDKE